jgi:hypothetical protein
MKRMFVSLFQVLFALLCTVIGMFIGHIVSSEYVSHATGGSTPRLEQPAAVNYWGSSLPLPEWDY